MLFCLPLVIALLTPSPAAAVPAPAAPEPAGACQNAADHAVLARFDPRIDDDMEDCAYTCMTSDLACARRCARQKLPVGVPCADCFAHLVDCTTSNCKLACMFSDAGCRACRAEKCNPAFVACAGIPAR